VTGDGSMRSSAQDLPAGLVLADRLAPVPLLRVGPNKYPVGTVAERLTRHSRKTRLDRLAEPPSRRKLPAQPLKGMKAQLTEAFALDDHPLVVPPRKEVPGNGQFLHTRVLGGHLAPEHFARCPRILPEIHHDVGHKAQHLGVGGYEPLAGPVDAPKRRAEARPGPFLITIHPEDGRDVRPRQRPGLHCKKGQDTLRAEGEVHGVLAALELESLEKPEADHPGWLTKGCASVYGRIRQLQYGLCFPAT
jgi:hypothetical protein